MPGTAAGRGWPRAASPHWCVCPPCGWACCTLMQGAHWWWDGRLGGGAGSSGLTGRVPVPCAGAQATSPAWCSPPLGEGLLHAQCQCTTAVGLSGRGTGRVGWGGVGAGAGCVRRWAPVGVPPVQPPTTVVQPAFRVAEHAARVWRADGVGGQPREGLGAWVEWMAAVVGLGWPLVGPSACEKKEGWLAGWLPYMCLYQRATVCLCVTWCARCPGGGR